MPRKYISPIKKVIFNGDINKTNDIQTKLLLELLKKYPQLAEKKPSENNSQ